MRPETMLEVDDLVVEYTRQGQSPLRAVDGVSLRIGAGEVVGIVGESGCGKSTLAKAIVGLVPPLSGSVRYQGSPVAPLRRRRRAAAAISLQMVFQDPHQSLNPRRTAGEQLRETARASAKATGRTIDEPLDEVVAGLLDRVGLPSTAAGRYPHEFSGGQRQRIAIARVLGTRPQLIVADEPVSALDASAQAQVANLLLDVAREEQIGLALISHDLAVVGAVSDRVAVMYLGEIVETGSTSEIWNAPRHPYTQALLSAIPLPDGQGRRPAVLAGEVGDPANPPSGCRFHPRCPLATPRCRSEAPPAVTLETGTTASCWETDRTALARTAVGDGER